MVYPEGVPHELLQVKSFDSSRDLSYHLLCDFDSKGLFCSRFYGVFIKLIALVMV